MNECDFCKNTCGELEKAALVFNGALESLGRRNDGLCPKLKLVSKKKLYAELAIAYAANKILLKEKYDINNAHKVKIEEIKLENMEKVATLCAEVEKLQKDNDELKSKANEKSFCLDDHDLNDAIKTALEILGRSSWQEVWKSIQTDAESAEEIPESLVMFIWQKLL